MGPNGMKARTSPLPTGRQAGARHFPPPSEAGALIQTEGWDGEGRPPRGGPPFPVAQLLPQGLRERFPFGGKETYLVSFDTTLSRNQTEPWLAPGCWSRSPPPSPAAGGQQDGPLPAHLRHAGPGTGGRDRGASLTRQGPRLARGAASGRT